MNLPPHDKQIKFDEGGVLLVKLPTSVVLQFHTVAGRIISDTAVPYFTFRDDEGLMITVKGAWESANLQVGPRHLSKADNNISLEIVKAMKELLEVT
jgi:hypothetical protein